jgi:hypothetical protein
MKPQKSAVHTDQTDKILYFADTAFGCDGGPLARRGEVAFQTARVWAFKGSLKP